MRSKLYLLFCGLFLLMGCSDQLILEDLGFVQAISFDKEGDEDGGILVTFRIPKADEATDEDSEVLSTIATTSMDAKRELSRETDRNLVVGQLRSTLFSSELAEEGLQEYIETLVRDPSVGKRVKVLVVEGSAHDLLSRDYPQHARTSRYIERLVEKEARVNMIPEVDLYSFSRDYLDDGIDPVVPLLKQGPEEIKVDGIALFDNDRYVSKLNPEDGFIFFFAREKTQLGDLNVKLEREGSDKTDKVMLASLLSDRKINVNASDINQITANIKIDLRGSILQYIGELNISEKSGRTKLEKDIERHIEERVEAMVKGMQELNVDSVGIGKYVRAELTYEEWKNTDWKKAYKNIDVTCDVNVTIRDYGTIEFISDKEREARD